MRLPAFALTLSLAFVLVSCGPGGPGPTSGRNALQALSLQTADVPSSFVRCDGLSGQYPAVSSAYLDGYADGIAWRSAVSAGAQDAWVEIYGKGTSACRGYRSASDPIAASGSILQSLVIRYASSNDAMAAFRAGQFVPAEPSGFMNPRTAVLYGTAVRGAATTAGANSFVDSGSVGSYLFSHAAFQKGEYVVTVFAENVAPELAQPLLPLITGRIPASGQGAAQASAEPISCNGPGGGGTGTVSGSQLMFPGPEVPALHIYAISSNIPGAFCMAKTVAGQRSYTIGGLPTGTYVIVAYTADHSGLAGGYTRAVPCGLTASCNDHSLIPVNVQDGQAVTDIQPNDWYTRSLPPEPHA